MTDEAAAFDALAEEFFSVWFRYHPDVAAEAGVRGFGRLLPAQGDDELSALGAWLETLVVALEELDYGSLDPDRQLDLRLMFGTARVEHQELLERDWRHRDPLRYLPVAEIYHLTLQPPPDIRDILTTLLAALPEYLRLALSQLRPMAELVAPAVVWAAVDEADLGRCYLRELVDSPWLRGHGWGFSEIETLAEGACAAFAAYAEALRSEIAPRAAGSLGCGESHLRCLFRHRHFMDLDPGHARARLGEALACCEDELASVCAALGITADGVRTHIEATSVEPSRRLDVCRSESERLAGLLRRSGLVSLPPAELRISAHPGCPRPRRLGSGYRADRDSGIGTYFLAAPAREGQGREPLACLRARCLDHTWGGTHLVVFSADDRGRRLPRQLCDGASLTGAWRLHLRARLTELGLLETDDHLLALLERREAIRQGLLDLDLHLGQMTDREARARIANGAGRGESDLVRLVRRPGEALAGVLGWLDLKRAKERAASREGKGFSERAFHDRLLAAGAIPLPLVIEVGLREGLSNEAAA
jgi:hypothetical protein